MRRGMALTGLLWLGLMLTIIGNHELILRTGQDVVLQTVPVDPRDLFRGDYVILSYAAGNLDLATLPNDLPNPKRGQTVYVALSTTGPHAAPKGVYAERPFNEPVCLRGRIERVSDKRVRVEYGIESFFVPEGKGHPLERARGQALEVVAAVDRSGRSAIKAVRLNGKDIVFQ